MPKISVVVPVYNEEGNLPRLLDEAEQALAPLDYELIFVDDGSADRSERIIRERMRANPRLRLVQFSYNFGQQAAFAAGYQAAAGDIIVTLDADLQNDPKYIPQFVERIENEGDAAVFGWRVNRENDFFLRQLPSRLFNLIRNSFLQRPLHDYGCAFTAFRRDFVDELRDSPEYLKHITTYIASRRVKYSEIRIVERPRLTGRSHYNFLRLLQLAMDLMILMSNKPVATMLLVGAGAVSSLLFVVSMAAAVAGLLNRGPEALWLLTVPFLFLMMALFSAVLMLINERVSSLIRNVYRRPPYIIKGVSGPGVENGKDLEHRR